MPEHYRIREASSLDAPNIAVLVEKNNYVSCNLPADLSLLQRCLATCRVFVLEESESKTIVGTSLIKDVSHRLVYEIEEKKTPEGKMKRSLKLILTKEGWVKELGGLLLGARVRKSGLARLLSYSRLCWLALQKQNDTNYLMTNFLLADHQSFWQLVAKETFSDMTWETVQKRLRDQKFISQAFKELPPQITLSPPTQETLLLGPGAPLLTPGGTAARALLEKIGFRYLKEIEIDGSVWYGNSVKEILARAFLHLLPGETKMDDQWYKDTTHQAIVVTNRKEEGFRASFADGEPDADCHVFVLKNA